MIFPSLLLSYDTSKGSGRLYAVNTLGAVAGALAAGFLLLPSIGATHTSWLAAFVIALAGVVVHFEAAQLAAVGSALCLGGMVAWLGAGDAASRRVHGYQAQPFRQLLHVDEGPDSTIWVTQEAQTHKRALIIDGFLATSEGVNTEYMGWMGHLPALAAIRLERALVICFGTGQTAYAVWQHAPARLDVVDISSAVLDAAGYFSTNHGVLEHYNVHATVMDGRAYLRRQSGARFDLVTLEPMPPNFVGVNNLYSTEFYRLVAARLSRTGVVAQWVPHHLVTTRHMRAIVAAFQRVFPYARLWQDPQSGTGILVGGSRPWSLHESAVQLSLTFDQIQSHFMLDSAQLTTLAAGATPVTDDNQLLAYGLDRLTRTAHGGQRWATELARQNHDAVRQALGAH
jgi:spermidine synthase